MKKGFKKLGLIVSVILLMLLIVNVNSVVYAEDDEGEGEKYEGGYSNSYIEREREDSDERGQRENEREQPSRFIPVPVPVTLPDPIIIPAPTSVPLPDPIIISAPTSVPLPNPIIIPAPIILPTPIPTPAIKTQNLPTTGLFLDLSNHFAQPYVFDLYQKGVITGQINFYPNRLISKENAVTMIVKLRKLPLQSSSTPYLQAAMRAGIINNTRGAKNKINRAEAVKMVVSAFGKNFTGQSPINTSFRDVNQLNWYAPYAEFARINGIMSGYKNNKFLGKNKINRAQMAKILSNAAKVFAQRNVKMPQMMSSNIQTSLYKAILQARKKIVQQTGITPTNITAVTSQPSLGTQIANITPPQINVQLGGGTQGASNKKKQNNSALLKAQADRVRKLKIAQQQARVKSQARVIAQAQAQARIRAVAQARVRAAAAAQAAARAAAQAQTTTAVS